MEAKIITIKKVVAQLYFNLKELFLINDEWRSFCCDFSCDLFLPVNFLKEMNKLWYEVSWHLTFVSDKEEYNKIDSCRKKWWQSVKQVVKLQHEYFISNVLTESYTKTMSDMMNDFWKMKGPDSQRKIKDYSEMLSFLDLYMNDDDKKYSETLSLDTDKLIEDETGLFLDHNNRLLQEDLLVGEMQQITPKGAQENKRF